jgi:tripartite-type tricarboxylate transporter receptor subunit TctC
VFQLSAAPNFLKKQQLGKMGLGMVFCVIGQVVLPQLSFAQSAPQAFPIKPVKIVVPFPAGGGGDNLARLMLAKLSNELGQPIVFENIPGAGGNIGAAAVARSNPDGYTLLYGTNGTQAINQTLYSKPGFNSQKGFEAIARLSSIALLMVVRPNLQVASMTELLQTVRAQPGKFTYGSAGNGTTSHLAMEILKSQANLFVVHVPYRGGAAAITDLIGGQIDMMIEIGANSGPQVKANRIKALATSTATRAPGFESLPTMAQSSSPGIDLRGFDVGAWDGLFAPVGTPKAVIDRINAALQKILNDPELRNQLAARGATPVLSSPQETTVFVGQEIDRWGSAVKRSGAKVD